MSTSGTGLPASPTEPLASVYATPKHVTDLKDCYFYHTMEIPGHGVVQGEWDLRGGEQDYLGRVDLRGKRVLELGTASGFLCFAMEKMGAEVVAIDLSENDSWDIVPYATLDVPKLIAERKAHIRKQHNGYWLAHRAFGSRARVVHSSVYQIPTSIGPFDVTTLGSILLHLRDPLTALERALSMTRETVVITEIPTQFQRLTRMAWVRLMGHGLFSRFIKPRMEFLPNARAQAPTETWWYLSPELLAQWISVLGFSDITFSYHTQRYQGRKVPLYTLVGRRPRPR